MDASCKQTSMRTSNYSHIPRYLHMVATFTLVILTIIHMHTRTHSYILAGVFLALAATGIILEKAPISRANSSKPSHALGFITSPKSQVAFSLFRATLYAFVGDAAAAQLLWTPMEGDAFDLADDDWAQLGLAGIMWIIGALLWISEPIIYWVNRPRTQSAAEDRYDALEGGYSRIPLMEEEDTIIVWEEEDFDLPVNAEKF